MAISKLEVGVVPLGVGGDSLRSAAAKINTNFEDPTNAASKLVGTGAEQIPLSKNIPSLLGTAATKNVGTGAGNVMEVGAFGLGSKMLEGSNGKRNPTGFYYLDPSTGANLFGGGSFAMDVSYFYVGTTNHIHAFRLSNTPYTDEFFLHAGDGSYAANSLKMGVKIWHGGNATKDSNGFLKGASPVIDMYDNKIDLNQDAEQQGGITFEKLGVGDYLVKGSLGFAQEGWHIETPKDTNGNVLVAVVEKQLENNDLSIKAYAKRFDEETGDIVPNLTRPRDIPTGRFISLRLHELPKEPPVMSDDIQTEV